MGHYDSSRPGYCACGAAPGNFVRGKCEFCHPSKKRPTLYRIKVSRVPFSKPDAPHLFRDGASLRAYKNAVLEFRQLTKRIRLDDFTTKARAEQVLAYVKKLPGVSMELEVQDYTYL